MSTLSPFLFALNQGALNKKPAKVFAFYYTKRLGKNPVFKQPIPMVEGDEDGEHVHYCECELCKGYMYMRNKVDLYLHFRKNFIEVIMQDENRFRMPSDELANLVLEYIANR